MILWQEQVDQQLPLKKTLLIGFDFHIFFPNIIFLNPSDILGEKAMIPIKKAFGEKKLAPRFDLKSGDTHKKSLRQEKARPSF